MMTEKKPGRPPSHVTLAKRAQIEAESLFMSERPQRQGQAAFSEMRSSENSTAWIANLEAARIKVLKEFKHGQSTPNQHAYEMASIGDEWFDGDNKKFAQKITDRDAAFRSKATQIRQKAGGSNIRKSRSRSELILEINSVLINKIETSPAFNTHSVALRIRKEWEAVDHLLSGELASLKRRGDGKQPVSVRQIERWIKASKNC
jgi:hypothetical protein